MTQEGPIYLSSLCKPYGDGMLKTSTILLPETKFEQKTIIILSERSERVTVHNGRAGRILIVILGSKYCVLSLLLH